MRTKGSSKRVKDECRHGDLVDDAGSGGAVVVVVRSGEPGIEGGDAVIQLAQRADSSGEIGIVDVRKECDLAAIAA